MSFNRYQLVAVATYLRFAPVIHIVDLERPNHPALRPKVTRTPTSRLS